MNVYMLVFICTSITFFATVLGCLLVFLIKEMNENVEKICLGLASGIMISASIFSLLLPALEDSSCLSVIISVLLGGFLILIMDKIFSHKEKVPQKKSMFFLAVTLHNIPEGMAVGLACALAYQVNSAVTLASAVALAVGIAIQNIPEGTAVSIAMLEQKKTRMQAFLYGVISGIVEPIAGILMAVLSHKLASFMPFFLSLAAGTMFYVVVDELIPNSKSEKNNSGVLSFMIGFVIMMYLDVILV